MKYLVVVSLSFLLVFAVGCGPAEEPEPEIDMLDPVEESVAPEEPVEPVEPVEEAAAEVIAQGIDLNTATASELEALPGVGPTRARSIADYRDEHGPFTSVDDLLAIEGIGSGTLDRIKGIETDSMTDVELDGPININTASASEIEQLPGIGPAYAQNVVDHRAEHGDFNDITEITNVTGIGPATFGNIQDLIAVE